jgi:hypothetical protein
MHEVLECMFSCSLCGMVKAKVYVPVRVEGQDIVDWMEKVCTPHIVEAHQMLSPECRAPTLENLLIPISDLGIGFPLTGREGGAS